VSIDDFSDLLQVADAMGEDSKRFTSRSRERLLASATKLFVERGYRHTSVEDIATVEGISRELAEEIYRALH